jgi:hypothetical protein
MKPEQSRGSQASSRKDSYPSVSALQLNATTLERRKTPSQELGSRSQGYFKKMSSSSPLQDSPLAI